jgi:hypothetical protein
VACLLLRQPRRRRSAIIITTPNAVSATVDGSGIAVTGVRLIVPA